MIIDQSERVETASIILAFSMAFLNVIINPHIYGKEKNNNITTITNTDPSTTTIFNTVTIVTATKPQPPLLQ